MTDPETTNPVKEVSSSKPKQNNATIQLIALIVVIGAFCAVIAILMKTSHLLREENAILTRQLQVTLQEKNKTAAVHEEELEKIHGIALDQGYKAAIWDVFFGTPLYLVQENGDDVSLWKKQNIDPETQARINGETLVKGELLEGPLPKE